MQFSTALVGWQEAEDALAQIRRRVFIEEQAVPENLEWDGLDDAAVHVLAQDATGQPIGCARFLPDGSIGRMAVLPDWRHCGVGREILTALIELARKREFLRIRLSAQTHAIPFYEKFGFRVCSDVYDDAGIPHRDMQLTLSD